MKTSMFLKLLALALALLMLVPALVACGDSGEETTTAAGDSGTGNGSNTTNNGGNKPNPTNYRNLDGYQYKAYICTNTDNASFPVDDFYVAEAKEDSISYAVVDRNTTIEDRYNCKIFKVDSNGDQFNEMETFYRGGVKYEMAALRDVHAASCATSAFLRDINSLEHLQLDEDYYDQNSRQQLGIAGKLYFFNGDFNKSIMDSTYVTLFNKNMLADYANFKDPYELVRNGEWTLDEMMTMANTATSVQGDRIVADATLGDKVGYFGYGYDGLVFFYGAGERITTTDTNGNVSLTVNSQTADGVITKIYDLMNRKAVHTSYPQGGGGVRNKSFLSGNTLFTTLILWDVRTQIYKSETLNFTYGILPTAKYSATDTAGQKTDYHCIVQFNNGTAALWSVPEMCNDIEKASFMLEVIASMSSASEEGSTMDAYYRNTLKLGAAQDAESIEALDVVRNSLCYDIALLYKWGDFDSFIKSINDSASMPSLSTKYAQDGMKAEVAMEKTISSFKNPSAPKN